MSFNFKQYVRQLLIEQTRVNMSGTGTASSSGGSVNTSNYEESPQGSGIYRSITGKDPYAYSIVSQNANKIVIKIEDAPFGRTSAIGRTFNITKNNLDDPNVQLLYSSLVSLGAITNRLSGDEASLKTGSKTAEILIVGDQFNSINHFKEQHNRIKSLGHELRGSTLTKEAPPAELTSQYIRDLTGTASQKIESIVAQIEKFAGIQVVSMTLERLDYQDLMIKYMGKKDEINYIHSEFQTDDTVQLCGELNEMIQAPPTDTPSESMEITVDSSAEPARETYQAMPGESGPGVNPGEDVDLRTSSFVETREGINVQLSDGTIEASLTLGRSLTNTEGALCVQIPNLGFGCYKNDLGNITGINYVNNKAITLIVKPIIGNEQTFPVTLDKAKKLINDIASGGSRLPEEIEIDGYTFEKVR